MKKKILTLILAGAMIAAFCGCGSTETASSTAAASGSTAAASSKYEEAGEPGVEIEQTYDLGNISVSCPKGWKAFAASDVFDEYDGDTNPNSVYVIKGGESEADLLTNPTITIVYYPEGFNPEPDDELVLSFYDDYKPLEDKTYGVRRWKRYTANSAGTPIAVLWTEADDDCVQANITLEGSNGKITLDDPEVEKILERIGIRKAN